MDSKEARELLRSKLVESVDPLLLESSLKRGAKSATYKRKLPTGRQEIEWVVSLPRFNDDASLFHLTTQVRVVVPPLLKLYDHAMSRVSGHVPIATQHVINLNLGLLMPGEQHQDWRPVTREAIPSILRQIANEVQQHALPFLDRYRDSSSFLQGYLEQDALLPRTDSWGVMMMCAAALEQESAEQRIADIFEHRFGQNPGLADRFAPARDEIVRQANAK